MSRVQFARVGMQMQGIFPSLMNKWNELRVSGDRLPDQWLQNFLQRWAPQQLLWRADWEEQSRVHVKRTCPQFKVRAGDLRHCKTRLQKKTGKCWERKGEDTQQRAVGQTQPVPPNTDHRVRGHLLSNQTHFYTFFNSQTRRSPIDSVNESSREKESEALQMTRESRKSLSSKQAVFLM